MLPKSQRLNLKKDFKWVASGKKIDSKYLKLFLKIGDEVVPKIGVAVSSKIFKKATERNRVKRVIFAAFEPLYAKLPERINIVALPKVSIVDVKSGDVLLDLEDKLNENHIIEDEH